MKIDAHTHTNVGSRTIPTSAAELIASMDKHGIDKALVFAGRFNDCRNDRLLRQLAPHAGRLYAVGCVSPIHDKRRATLDSVQHLLRTGKIVALKFYLGYEHYYPTDKRIRPYLELLQQHGVPAIFHTGDCYTKVGGSILEYAHPLTLDALACEMPHLTIVMAHCGNPWLVDGAEVVYNKPNVVADCSGFICGKFGREGRKLFGKQLRKFIRYVGTTEKLMFGTDWPIARQGSYLKAMDSIGLKSKQLDQVMGGNAARIFKLT